MMKQKIKILWCDRNILKFRFSEFLISLEHVEILACETIEEAFQKYLEDNSIKLVISGNYFGQGLELFNRTRTSSRNDPFLLFSGDLLSNLEPYLMIKGFHHFSKFKFSIPAFKRIVEELTDNSISLNDINLRMKAIRNHLALSPGQFGALINKSAETVEKFEALQNVPSSYVVTVCNRFNIPMNLLETLTLNMFTHRLENNSLTSDEMLS